MSAQPTPSTGPHRRIRLVRVIRGRPRLFLSLLLGLASVLFLILACDWRLSAKLLTGWNIGIGLYLILAVDMMARSDVARMKLRAARQDEGQFAMLVLIIASAIACLSGIFFELGSTSGTPRNKIQLLLVTSSVLLSWFFIHVMFAFHYAHEFYGEGRDHKIGGMQFPGADAPDYWDFAYFSFTIGMCAQVSDVVATSRPVRRTVLVQSILSFLFNVALLALVVNIAASAI
jgi:uncharacterized membrane protein